LAASAVVEVEVVVVDEELGKAEEADADALADALSEALKEAEEAESESEAEAEAEADADADADAEAETGAADRPVAAAEFATGVLLFGSGTAFCTG